MLKQIFEPLRILDKRTLTILVAVEVLLALAAWQLSGNGLIPTPTKVLAALGHIVQMPDFLDNLFASLSLTMKGMFISIAIALLISYLSIVPFFSPSRGSSSNAAI
ncbi:hypothetical protein MKQ70_24095 [Chitinophaga sedimenti]|uniref:hypothetical protein n=1 Tax=Chitinophaga sedimenti TaxID=2033606 RepID=UPI002002AB6F|nr:hypothetical protein [Chitinophaga sedimenti]MCK7557922.1 hypothetical protein [Chitinophaga sedimenti]